VKSSIELIEVEILDPERVRIVVEMNANIWTHLPMLDPDNLPPGSQYSVPDKLFNPGKRYEWTGMFAQREWIRICLNVAGGAALALQEPNLARMLQQLWSVWAQVYDEMLVIAKEAKN
jgi:hypothetical protein